MAHLVIVLAEESGGGRRAVGTEPHVGLELAPALGGDPEGREHADIDRGKEAEGVAGEDLHPALSELVGDGLTDLRLVVTGGQNPVGGLQHGHLDLREGRGDLTGQLDADGAGAHDEHSRGVLEVGVNALDTGLGDDGGGLHVLGGEGVGGPGGQHQVVGLDLPVTGDLDGGASHGQRRSVNDAPVGEELVVGQEDLLRPVTVDRSAQRRGVADEGVLLLHEGDLGDVVEGLGGSDATVSTADDGDASHIVFLPVMRG